MGGEIRGECRQGETREATAERGREVREWGAPGLQDFPALGVSESGPPGATQLPAPPTPEKLSG